MTENDAQVKTYRGDLLAEAKYLTEGPRKKAYGEPLINLTCAGQLKLITHKYQQRVMSAGEIEAIDLCLTKIARIVTGKDVVYDNYIDLAAFAAIAGELAQDYLARTEGQSAKPTPTPVPTAPTTPTT